MIRNLLLLLVMISCVLSSQAQNAEILANCLYQSSSGRVIIRIALRNQSGSPSPIEFVGIRFGVQYNAAAVTFDGYASYMYNLTNPGLNDASYLSFIGADNALNVLNAESPATRIATINTGGTKTLQLGYINRSTDVCTNANIITPGTYKVLIDIYFKLVNNNPAYYHLNNPNYGFNDPEFIAQFLTKDNGGLTGNLTDPYKEIAIVNIRQGSTSNPYQPFDMAGCKSSAVDPVVVTGNNVSFINPINGILAGNVVSLQAAEKNNQVQLNWQVNNNELVDEYIIERKDGTGEYQTAGIVFGNNDSKTTNYSFTDKVYPDNNALYYRIKLLGTNGIVCYSEERVVRKVNTFSNSITVFPNPAKDFIQFKLNNVAGNYLCRVYNSAGKLVLSGNITTAADQMNIAALPPGSYFADIYHLQSSSRYTAQFNKQ